MTQRLLLALVRVPGLLVTGFLAAGSLAVGMGVMTDCTNTYSCGPTNCGPCLAPNLLLVGGWAVQVVLFLAASALCLPPVARRLRPSTLATCALAVAVVAIMVFAGVSWAADRSY